MSTDSSTDSPADTCAKLPLFQLHAVLMPGGRLQLRVFEARYLDMVARCMAADEPFGAIAIDSGHEIGAPATPHRIGTLARIIDWDQGGDGMLEITVAGHQRFQLLGSEVRPDRLTVAEVQPIPDDLPTPMPEGLDFLADGLGRILDQAGQPFAGTERHNWDATWVSNRLTEVLPMPLTMKLELLASLDPERRINDIAQWIQSQAGGKG